MFKSSTATILCALTLSACDATGPGVPILGRHSLPVVNGQTTTAYPEVGKLTVGSKLCSATLVGKKTVLTAAHCVSPGSAHTFHVEGQKYPSASAVRHPSYSSSAKQYDVAVVLLQTEPPVTPASINLGAPSVGLQVTIVGYGRTGEGKGDQGVKRVGTNTVAKLTSTHLTMSGAANGDANICDGDSGGPTFATVGGKWVQIGVHSTKTNYCGYAGNDIRVDTYASWIKTTAGGDANEDGGTGTAPPTPPPAPPSSGGGAQPCAPCSSSSDCGGASDFCVKNTSGETFCTADCSAGQACPTGWSCKLVGGALTGQQCLPPNETCQSTSPTPPATPPATQDTTPPAVSILSPTEGTIVGSTVTVKASASDDVGVVKTDLQLDGALVKSFTASAFSYDVTVSSGSHELRVVAYDAAGNSGVAQITITGDGGDPGLSPPSNEAPGPAPMPTTGGFGDSCYGPDDCESGLCAMDPSSGDGFCTRACTASSDCPDSVCQPASGGLQVCSIPAGTGANSLGPEGLVGSCSVSDGGRPRNLAVIALLLLCAAIVRRVL